MLAPAPIALHLLALAAITLSGSAHAACLPTTNPTSGDTVTCSGTSTTPVTAAGGSIDVRVNVDPGATLDVSTGAHGILVRDQSRVTVGTGSRVTADGAGGTRLRGIRALGDDNTVEVTGGLIEGLDQGREAIQMEGNRNRVDLDGATVSTTQSSAEGIELLGGTNGTVLMTGSTVSTQGRVGRAVRPNGDGHTVTVAGGSRLETRGANAPGIDSVGNQQTLSLTGASHIDTGGNNAYGIRTTGDRNRITLSSGSSITTTGRNARGLEVVNSDDGTVILDAARITTEGRAAHGVFLNRGGDNTLDVSGTATISTSGSSARGIYSNSARNAVTVGAQTTIDTSGSSAHGVQVRGAETVSDVRAATVTRGSGAHGVLVSGTDAVITVDGSVATAGANARGVQVQGTRAQATVNGTVSTTGSSAEGLYLSGSNAQMTSGAAVSTAGANAHGAEIRGSNASFTNTGSIVATGNGGRAVTAPGGVQRIFNAGVLTGGPGADAVNLGSGNDVLTLRTGSSVRGGDINAAGGSNDLLVLEGEGSEDNRFVSFESFQLDASGVWVLAGDNASSFRRGLDLNSGTLSVAADANLGVDTADLDFDGGVLRITGTSFAAPAAGRAFVLGAGGGGVDVDDASHAFTINQVISGTGAMQKLGAGTLVLTANNTYSGGTRIDGGTLSVASDQNLGAAAGPLTFDGGTLRVTGTAFATTTRTVTLNAGGGGIDVEDAGQVFTFNQVITGPGALSKLGAGTLSLTADNTFGGGMNVNEGVVVVDRDANLGAPAGPLTFGGGTLRITGPGFDSPGRQTTLNAGGGVFDVVDPAAVVVLGRPMSGVGGLTKVGDGAMVLSGASTYSGGTVLDKGTLRLSTGASLSPTGRLTVNAGLFDLNDNSVQVGALEGTGGQVDLGAGTLTVHQSASTAFAGAIAGTGGLTKSGTGALTLTSAHSYAGPTTVNGGALILAPGASLSSSTALMLNGGRFQQGGNDQRVSGLSGTGGVLDLGSGELEIQQNFNSDYEGVITGSGRIVKSGPGVLALSGANDYSGGTTVSAGTLAGTTSSLQGDILNNANLRFDQGFDGSYGGAITGSGTLHKLGAGSVRLSGTNSLQGQTTVSAGALGIDGVFSGPVRVEGGELTLNGTLDGPVDVAGGTFLADGIHSGQVNVISGELQGSGRVGSTTLGAGGRIAPGGGGGGDAVTLTIDGDYRQLAGSTLTIEMSPDGSSDRLDVSGRATIEGGELSLARLAAEDQFDPDDIYTVISAGGGVSGAFDSLSSDFTFLSPEVRYDPTAVLVSLAQSASFESAAVTLNQEHVAAALDRTAQQATGDYEHVIDELLTLPSQQAAREAYDALGGAMHATWTTVGLLEQDMFLAAIQSSRRRGVEQPFGLSHASFSGAGGYALAGSALGGAASAQAPESDEAVWGQIFGAPSAELESDGNAGGLDYSLGGFAIGADARPTAETRLGVSLGYTSSDGDFDDFDGSAEADTWHGAIYGGWNRGPWSVDAAFAFSNRSNETKRRIAFGDINRVAKGDYDSDAYSALGAVRYLITSTRVDFEPVVALRYQQINNDDFAETGADSVNLVSPGDNLHSLRSLVGVRFGKAHHSGNRVFIPEGRLGWEHEYKDTSANLDARFSGAPGSGFTVRGVDVPRDSLLVGFGVRVEMDENLALFADYDGRFNGKQRVHQVYAGLRFDW